jgi:hypothetical protein
MVEVQSHGFFFENWIRENFFEQYAGGYVQKWDIPQEFNRHKLVPTHLHDIEVSVKTAKYGSPIDLGDVLRQRMIGKPFLMIVGFWRQRTPFEKWFEDIGWVKFTPAEWNDLWGTLDMAQLLEIDRIVKDRSLHYSDVRQQAKAWKTNVANNSGSQIVINPKIDSKAQRRIQCSIPFSVFWKYAGRSASIQDHPELFGFRFKNPHLSSARTFNRG